MLAREVMSSPVVAVAPSTPIQQVAQLLADRGFSAVPVLDDDRRLVGIISEADLIRFPLPPDPRRQPHWVPDRRHPAPRLAADIMSTTVESLTPGADIADAARMMVDENIRCLPIVDGADVVGVITRRDLLRCSIAHDDTALLHQVNQQLGTLGDADRWTVTVQGGVADISDFRNDPADRDTARRLACAVPGVVRADVRHLTPDPS